MLDQLRNFAATAQAIQADVNAITAPAKPQRVKPPRWLTFYKSSIGGIRVSIETVNASEKTISITDRDYDRFVRLANSGNYAIEILDSDWGVAWTLFRKGN